MVTPPRRAGFTLLEVMVVLAIIGIVVGVATLTVDTRPEEVEEGVRRMAAVTKLAAEEAVLRSRELAVQVETGGYRFLGLAEGEFVPLTGDALFGPRSLPEGLVLSLFLEGEPVELEVEEGVDQDDIEQPPRIYLLSSGEMTPFELQVRDQYSETKWSVIGELTGAVTVEPLP